MAKEKKVKKEKTEKHEKKVSTDKVKKHKKEKKEKREKSKRAATPDSSDNELAKVEDTPAVAVQSADDPMPAAPTELTDDQKKQAKKAAKAKAKAEKQAAETATTEGASTSTALPMRNTTTASEGDDAKEAPPLFTIDTNPTPVDLNSIATREPITTDKVKGGKNKGTKPPSGLNRSARRRIKLIERQRETIQKKLGVPVGSNEKADEVQEQLDKWTAIYDDKTAIRMEKKRIRKEKDAMRIRNKRGKILTGRKLKERKQQLERMEKKQRKKQNAAGDK
ncbi:hypothetical protein F4779DRAFT_607697 [Xylariaceae sp. FL0662B]|nr:hypothetical protein F4779DRAFT_607697 [Xylariaceae sp. FL0662B]